MRSELSTRIFGIALGCRARRRASLDLEVIRSAARTRRSPASPTTPSTRTSPSGMHADLGPRRVIGQRTARARTNRRDREAIRASGGRGHRASRALTEPDPDLPPLAERRAVEPVDRYFEATAACHAATSVPAPSPRRSASSSRPGRPRPASTRRARRFFGI